MARQITRRQEDPVTTLNRDLAEALFGYRHGRPTISMRTGGVISEMTNGALTPTEGKELFHLGLGALFVAAVIKAAK